MSYTVTATNVSGYDYEWRIVDRLGHTVSRGFARTYEAAADAAEAWQVSSD